MKLLYQRIIKLGCRCIFVITDHCLIVNSKKVTEFIFVAVSHKEHCYVIHSFDFGSIQHDMSCNECKQLS
jgi:hypothetical protein